MLVEALETLACLLHLALGQFDQAQQHMQDVGVATEAQCLQLAHGLLAFVACQLQLAEGEQAAGAVELQHRCRCVGLRVALQSAVDQAQAVSEIAAEHGQAAAQEGQGLVYPFRMALRYFVAFQQPPQLLQAAPCAGDVVGDDHRAGIGHGQGEMVGTIVPGHIGEEVDDGIDPTFAQQVETVALDGCEQGIEVLGSAQLVNRFCVALMCDQPFGGLPVQLAQMSRRLALQALVERAAQHRVVAIGQALTVALLDEYILAL
ncbi:hypothetical protein D3C76_674730 [compost metagenome]